MSAGWPTYDGFPGSRRHPHFSQDPLSRFLTRNDIQYRHFEALGGRRSRNQDSPHTAWKVAGFQGYADYMQTEAFGMALSELLEWARDGDTTVMCAEAFFVRCHRRLLADSVLAQSWQVVHILGLARVEEHSLTPFARRDEGRLIYDGGTLPLDLPE